MLITFWPQDQREKKSLLHSVALALTLTLALTQTFNHLANELLQATIMLYGLMLRQHDRIWIFNKVHDGL